MHDCVVEIMTEGRVFSFNYTIIHLLSQYYSINGQGHLLANLLYGYESLKCKEKKTFEKNQATGLC